MARNKDEAPDEEPTEATEPVAEAVVVEPETVPQAEDLDVLDLRDVELHYVNSTAIGDQPWIVVLRSDPGDPSVTVTLQYDSDKPVNNPAGKFTVTIKETK